MQIDHNGYTIFWMIALCLLIVQPSQYIKGERLPWIMADVYAKEYPQDRWENQSPFSTRNPAALPLSVPSYQKNNIHIQNHLIVANQIVSIRELFHDWEGPFSPHNTNKAVISGETSLSFGRNQWRLSYLRRIELFLWANRGLVELAWYDKNKVPFPMNLTYPLHMEGDGFEAHGLKLSYGKAFSYLENKEVGCGVAISFLRGIRMQKLFLEGQAQVVGSKDYDYSGFMNYYYNHNYLYDRDDADIGHGNGISFDIGIGLDITQRLSMGLLLHDIWGQIWWQDVPYTYAQFDSQNKEYDENGYVEYNPRITGRESEADYKQRIQPKTNLCLNYHLEDWAFLISADLIERDIYPNAYLYSNALNTLDLYLGYDLFFQQYHILMKYRAFLLGVSFDRIEPERAKAVSLTLDIGIRY